MTLIFGFISIFIFSFFYMVDFRKYDTLSRTNRDNFTSFSAGVGAVYVIIHMLPQLSYGQDLLREQFPNMEFIGNRYAIYVFVLLGFILLYLFERVLEYTNRLPTDDYSEQQELYFYWTNIIFILLYNMLIGYIVGSNHFNSVAHLLIYTIAFSLHFIALSWGMFQIAPEKYNRQARYPLVLGLFLGYFIALFMQMPDYILLIIEAIVTGAMLLNVFKHELPNEQDTKAKFFLIGIVLATALFIFV